MSTLAEQGAVGSAAGAAPHDVVFVFSYVNWQGAQRRGMCFSEDRLVETLLEHESVRRLLICEPFRSLPVKLARALVERRQAAPFPANERRRRYEPHRLRVSDPVSLRSLERAYAAYERRIERAATRYGLQRPAVIVAHPILAGFGDFSWARSVTYYAIDDWASYPPNRRWWDAYRESYRRLRETGRRVCAISDAAVERIRPTGPWLALPNGVEPSEWQRPAAPPAWFEERGSPRLLYIGSLDERLDVAALSDAARAHPDASLTLVGPLLNARHLEPLRAHGNVAIHPAVDRHTVVALVSSADLCLIPHVRNALTEAMSPLKLYEYLAGGRPVASVALGPIERVESPRLVLQRDGEAFSETVRRALTVSAASTAERAAFLAEHAWRARHERLLELALA